MILTSSTFVSRMSCAKSYFYPVSSFVTSAWPCLDLLVRQPRRKEGWTRPLLMKGDFETWVRRQFRISSFLPLSFLDSKSFWDRTRRYKFKVALFVLFVDAISNIGWSSLAFLFFMLVITAKLLGIRSKLLTSTKDQIVMTWGDDGESHSLLFVANKEIIVNFGTPCVILRVNRNAAEVAPASLETKSQTAPPTLRYCTNFLVPIEFVPKMCLSVPDYLEPATKL
jgi:hypothetical protein